MSFCFGVCKVRSLSIHHSSHCALQLIGYIKLIYAKLFVIESNQTVIVAPSSPAPHILQHFRDLCSSTAQHDAWVSVWVYSWVSVCLFVYVPTTWPNVRWIKSIALHNLQHVVALGYASHFLYYAHKLRIRPVRQAKEQTAAAIRVTKCLPC